MHLHTLWDSQSYFPKQSTRKAKASDSLFVFDPLNLCPFRLAAIKARKKKGTVLQLVLTVPQELL